MIAVASTLFVAISWIRSWRGLRIAKAAAVAYQSDVSTWESVVIMDAANRRMDVQNDELEVQNDDMQVEIARDRGHGVAEALRKRDIDEALLGSARLSRDFEDSIGSEFTDPRVAASVERRDASAASASVYLSVIHRDQYLACVAGAIWLAFGFAAALTQRPMTISAPI